MSIESLPPEMQMAILSPGRTRSNLQTASTNFVEILCLNFLRSEPSMRLRRSSSSAASAVSRSSFRCSQSA